MISLTTGGADSILCRWTAALFKTVAIIQGLVCDGSDLPQNNK